VTKLDAAVPSRRSLPREALALAVAMAVANATNYGFSLVMAFLLGPAAYGALGALLARVVGKAHSARLETQLGRGGLLLWVRTPDPEHEQRAIDILKQHGAEDVHVHTLPGETVHRTDGVSGELSFMKALGL